MYCSVPSLPHDGRSCHWEWHSAAERWQFPADGEGARGDVHRLLLHCCFHVNHWFVGRSWIPRVYGDVGEDSEESGSEGYASRDCEGCNCRFSWSARLITTQTPRLLRSIVSVDSPSCTCSRSAILAFTMATSMRSFICDFEMTC